jgi:hypothetical protein
MNFDKSEAVTLIVGSSEKDELLVHANETSKNSSVLQGCTQSGVAGRPDTYYQTARGGRVERNELPGLHIQWEASDCKH